MASTRSRRKNSVALEAVNADQLDTILIEEIRTVYASWGSGSRRSERRLTVNVLVDYVDNRGPGIWWRAYRRKTQAIWVRNAIGRLERAGLIIHSLGVSPDTGRETMMWEPAK